MFSCLSSDLDEWSDIIMKTFLYTLHVYWLGLNWPTTCKNTIIWTKISCIMIFCIPVFVPSNAHSFYLGSLVGNSQYSWRCLLYQIENKWSIQCFKVCHVKLRSSEVFHASRSDLSNREQVKYSMLQGLICQIENKWSIPCF